MSKYNVHDEVYIKSLPIFNNDDIVRGNITEVIDKLDWVDVPKDKEHLFKDQVVYVILKQDGSSGLYVESSIGLWKEYQRDIKINKLTDES